MAKSNSKNNCDTNGNGDTLGFEAELFKAADIGELHYIRERSGEQA